MRGSTSWTARCGRSGESAVTRRSRSARAEPSWTGCSALERPTAEPDGTELAEALVNRSPRAGSARPAPRPGGDRRGAGAARRSPRAQRADPDERDPQLLGRDPRPAGRRARAGRPTLAVGGVMGRWAADRRRRTSPRTCGPSGSTTASWSCAPTPPPGPPRSACSRRPWSRRLNDELGAGTVTPVIVRGPRRRPGSKGLRSVRAAARATPTADPTRGRRRLCTTRSRVQAASDPCPAADRRRVGGLGNAEFRGQKPAQTPADAVQRCPQGRLDAPSRPLRPRTGP